MTIDIPKATGLMIRAVRDWSLGYGQGSGTGGRHDIRDGGAADCSSLVSWAYNGGGLTPTLPDDTYTGNIRERLVARGFTVLDPATTTPRAGDSLLWEGHHVAMCVADDLLAEAWINELGTTTGGQPGDQTGQETRLQQASTHPYRHAWTHLLRPPTAEGIFMALTDRQQADMYNRVMGGIPGQRARGDHRTLDTGDGDTIVRWIKVAIDRATAAQDAVTPGKAGVKNDGDLYSLVKSLDTGDVDADAITAAITTTITTSLAGLVADAVTKALQDLSITLTTKGH